MSSLSNHLSNPLSESDILSELSAITESLKAHPRIMSASIRADLEERFEFIVKAWTTNTPLTYNDDGTWETPEEVLMPSWMVDQNDK